MEEIFQIKLSEITLKQENIQNIATCQGDNSTTRCLLNDSHCKKHYQIIATDLGKQQELDADSKAIQQINFTGNIKENATMFFCP